MRGPHDTRSPTMTEATTVPNDDVVVFLPGGGRASAALVAVPQAEAEVNVADLAVTRGDGVFESIGVVAGRPLELPRHLARLAHSAGLLELPAPDLAAFEAA